MLPGNNYWKVIRKCKLTAKKAVDVENQLLLKWRKYTPKKLEYYPALEELGIL